MARRANGVRSPVLAGHGPVRPGPARSTGPITSCSTRGSSTAARTRGRGPCGPRSRRARWEAEQPEFAFRVAESRWFRLPLSRALSATMARRLLARRSSRLKRRIRSLKRVDCIVVSDRIIRGRFRDGLTVGVIPMAMVERTEIEPPRRGKAPDTDGRSRLLAPVDIHHDLRAARVVAGHRAHRRGELAARKRCAVVLPEPLLREPEARRRRPRVEGHGRRKPRGPEPRLVLGERVVRALRRCQAERPACSHGSASPYRASAPS